MVEAAYENYLVKECNKQRSYKRSLERDATKHPTDEANERARRIAKEFELTRCTELNDLFPKKMYRSYNWFSKAGISFLQLYSLFCRAKSTEEGFE